MTVDAALASRTPVGTAPRTPYAALAGLGALLLTWILVIPPFGGIDEFDHAYRAASAARGEWFPTPSDATRGTGAWLDVPTDVVAAAQPQCQALRYTTDADCVGTVHGSTVRIASGAGRYHPLFYALIGTAALPFDGTAALYVMRLATAAMALALVAMALGAIGTWARSRTAYLVPVLACTPMVVYSCSIASPNGLEVVAGLGLCAAGVGLLVADETHLRRLAVMVAVAGGVLCTLRPLGPLWCLAAAAAVLLGVRAAPGRIRALVRRRDSQIAFGVVALCALQGALWTMVMGALRIGQVDHPVHTSVAHRLGEAVGQVPLWVLQSIAAFPMRGDATQPSVYLCGLLIFGTLLVVAWRAGDRRVRLGLVAAAGVSVLVPVASTVSSYDAVGLAWQGRYGLPFAVSLVVLAGYGLDRSSRPVPTTWLVAGGALFVVAQAVSAVNTLHVEMGTSPLVHDSAWLRPPLWVVAVLAVAGAAWFWWGSQRPTRLGEPHA